MSSILELLIAGKNIRTILDILCTNKNVIQNFLLIVTTPTEPQLNSKVGFDTKMTFNHHHHHHKLNDIDISAVPDPILTNI